MAKIFLINPVMVFGVSGTKADWIRELIKQELKSWPDFSRNGKRSKACLRVLWFSSEAKR
jgi:hypothetical protein